MKSKRTIFFLLLSLTALAASGFTKRQGRGAAEEKIPLTQFVSIAARNAGCHYTVEYLRSDVMSLSPLEETRLPDTIATVKTADDLVNTLTKYLPNAVVWKDKGNPKIVHLMDRGLSKLPDYAMNKVGDLSYDGLLWKLPSKIAADWEVPLVASQSYTLDEMGAFAFFSKVHFTSIKESVRSLLSNHPAPDHKYTLLWTARTVEKPRLQTEVLFYR